MAALVDWFIKNRENLDPGLVSGDPGNADIAWLESSADQINFEKFGLRPTVEQAPTVPLTTQGASSTDKTRGRKRGRQALADKFPGIVNSARSFITDNGFEAHRRRRSHGTCGVSLSQVRDHLMTVVPQLKESNTKLDKKTISHWFQPPNRRFKASQKYAGLIDAKVPPKSNSRSSPDDNDHYFSARVRYCLEMAAKFDKSATVFSLDNKNKVKVGSKTLAVDRHLQICRIFPTNDVPNYYDHDFPTPGYLITPAGYLRLEPPHPPQLTVDKIGRKHFELPKTIGMTVINRGPSEPCTIEAHANDLMGFSTELKDDGKTIVVLIVDGGPDYNVNHETKEVYYSRIFKQLNLDGMIITSYCPGFSRRNPIEHVWSPLTRLLTSVYLDDTLPGENKPPCHQTELSAGERKQKEYKVFDKAMDNLAGYWENATFAGHPVKVQNIPSGTPNAPFNDYDEARAIINGSYSGLVNSPGIKAEVDFAHMHMDRRIGMLLFSKCHSELCVHCNENPIRDISAWGCIRTFPSPVPSPHTEGHFRTFHEALQTERCAPDEYLPRYIEGGLGRCDKCPLPYVYTSKTNKINHLRKVHPLRV
ncbi:uncharacterized protein LOC119741815 [Patiria miniata]|uniref:C2H2-type domain-containing protein n=1 Tax=Patiria miniata TaxID=46514 RepID=A0A914BC70_PATMI|nr:uncharacterized protein LOC119731345 [Patiria miniata]XP_038073644.1 uncharacterized protein LOC119741815 [Patiria miniata]